VIRLGYACINTTLPAPNRTCRLRSATPERLLMLARGNLTRLVRILQWNATHRVHVFRIGSEVIPFGSHPVNQLPWWELLERELHDAGQAITACGMRVSMHPGQFTVLNSPREEVAQRSIAELVYHARVLDVLGTDASAKIILHLGGTFGDKPTSLARFIDHGRRLPEPVLRRLVLENDEKSYTVEEALAAADALQVPVVFDVFHHYWNPAFPSLPLRQIVQMTMATWRATDGRPKLHYSDQWPGKPPGAHSATVDVEAFRRLYEGMAGLPLDIMLEVKDKERSVLNLYRIIPGLRPVVDSMGAEELRRP
jgi:UV DNA damage endonuclease